MNALLDDEIVVMEEGFMLSTSDNPYNPREDYDKWRRWDIDKGYNTEALLARYIDIPLEVDVDDDLTIQQITQEAILILVEHDVTGMLILV